MTRWIVLIALIASVYAAATASARVAHFAVTVTVTGPGKVTGSGSGGSFDCPSACSANILQSSSITLTATPGEGDTFTGWGGDCAGSGTEPTCTLVVDGTKSVSAGFDAPPPPPPKYVLSVAKSGTGTGYVGGAAGIDCGPTCTASATEGTSVTLVGVPDEGSELAAWSGACSGTGACTVTITADTSVTATFNRLDRSPPLVSVPRQSARRGTTARLYFKAWDDSGRSREIVSVLKGEAAIFRIDVPMRSVVRDRLYSVRWQVPATLRPGVRRICVVGIDEAGNRSPRRCAALTVA